MRASRWDKLGSPVVSDHVMENGQHPAPDANGESDGEHRAGTEQGAEGSHGRHVAGAHPMTYGRRNKKNPIVHPGPT
jgi:hypothetical protein